MLLREKIRLERIDLNIPKFREVVGNSKLIQLSDLHISKFGYREKSLVQLVNREQPDLLLITGDLLVNYKSDFLPCVQTLQKLNAKFGIFGVFGNSDHTIGSVQYLRDFENALKDIDVTILNNRNIELGIMGKNFYLVGVDDTFFLFDNFEKAIEGVPSGAPAILLAHSPDIMFPRSDALVINLLESEFGKDHFKGWGWQDRTRFGPENGYVYFKNDGLHTIRIQSRQDGVFIDTILLNPYKEIDVLFFDKNFKKIHCILTSKEMLGKYPDLVIISAADIDQKRIHGKWEKGYDSSAMFNSHLNDLPPRGNWYFQPAINPKDYFEADFVAPKGVRYHIWCRMRAYNGSPKNDSVYIQFNDSVDKYGMERYRIGKPAYSKGRMKEIDLILTGHTHGGQIRIPFYGALFTMTSIGRKYSAGLYNVGKSMCYVSRGIGTSILPIRFLCPPEITIFNFL